MSEHVETFVKFNNFTYGYLISTTALDDKLNEILKQNQAILKEKNKTFFTILIEIPQKCLTFLQKDINDFFKGIDTILIEFKSLKNANSNIHAKFNIVLLEYDSIDTNRKYFSGEKSNIFEFVKKLINENAINQYWIIPINDVVLYNHVSLQDFKERYFINDKEANGISDVRGAEGQSRTKYSNQQHIETKSLDMNRTYNESKNASEYSINKEANAYSNDKEGNGISDVREAEGQSRRKYSNQQHIEAKSLNTINRAYSESKNASAYSIDPLFSEVEKTCIDISINKKLKVLAFQADILKMGVDGIVCAIGEYISIDHGFLAAVIERFPELKQKLSDRRIYTKLHVGDVLVENVYSNNSKIRKIYFVVLPTLKYTKQHTPYDLEINELNECLRKLFSKIECNSISTPVLGSGLTGFSYHTSIKALLENIFNSEMIYFKEVYIVDIDDEFLREIPKLVNNIKYIEFPEIFKAAKHSAILKNKLKKLSEIKFKDKLIKFFNIDHLPNRTGGALSSFIYPYKMRITKIDDYVKNLEKLYLDHQHKELETYKKSTSDILKLKLHGHNSPFTDIIYFPVKHTENKHDIYEKLLILLEKSYVTSIFLPIIYDEELTMKALINANTTVHKFELFFNDMPTLENCHTAIKKFMKISTEITQSTHTLTTISSDNRCSICLNAMHNEKLLNCNHSFCKKCIEKALKVRNACPICSKPQGKITGNQPDGEMKISTINDKSLPGYDYYGMYEIKFVFPDGIQDKRHRSPGSPYTGTKRKAYLPNNSEGNELLSLLKEAFDRKLLFTIGKSLTKGIDNIVTFNDIHLKTSITGGPANFGYPDEGYFDRLRQELKAKGIE